MYTVKKKNPQLPVRGMSHQNPNPQHLHLPYPRLALTRQDGDLCELHPHPLLTHPPQHDSGTAQAGELPVVRS